MWYTNHVIIWYFYHNHHCLQYSCHFFTDFWPVGIFFRTVLCCGSCDRFYLLYWICPPYLDCKLSVSGNEQVQSHDPFPRFFWRYCGSTHNHSCFFPVRVRHFPHAACGKNFPPVPSECQIWLFQRNYNCFIWKKKSDHLLCFYCADSHARQQSVHVQRRTRCTAGGIPQRFQWYLVEHVNASHRRLRRYLPDHNTCYLCFRKKTRFWNWMILLLYVGRMVKYTRQQWLLLCHKKA